MLKVNGVTNLRPLNLPRNKKDVLTCTLAVASKILAVESSGYVLLEDVQADFEFGLVVVRTERKQFENDLFNFDSEMFRNHSFHANQKRCGLLLVHEVA